MAFKMKKGKMKEGDRTDVDVDNAQAPTKPLS